MDPWVSAQRSRSLRQTFWQWPVLSAQHSENQLRADSTQDLWSTTVFSGETRCISLQDVQGFSRRRLFYSVREIRSFHDSYIDKCPRLGQQLAALEDGEGSPLSTAGLSASFPDSLLTSPLLLAHSVWRRSQRPTYTLSRLYPCLWIDSSRHTPHSVKWLMPHPFGLLYQWTCRDKILRQVLQYLWAFKTSTEAMKSEFLHLPSCHQHPESPPTLPGATSSLAKDASIKFS